MSAQTTILRDCQSQMEASISRMGEEIKKLRTGRANSSLVEDIKVSYWGALTPLVELAMISIPEPNLIQIKPFDKNSIGDIESAIRNADLGINPINDGNFVRLSLPPLTEERRLELVKQLKKMAEDTKVALRNTRSEVWEMVQEMVKDKELTEDDKYRLEKELNDLIEKMNKKVDQIVCEKEKDLMRI